MKKLFFFVFLLFVSQITFSQNVSNAELFEVLGNANCETIRNRTDNFWVNLKENPQITGYIVFYASKNLPTFAFYEHAVKSHIEYRKIPAERVKFIYAKSEKDFKFEFWLSKSGAKPNVAEDETNSFLMLKKGLYKFSEDWFEISKSDGKLAYVHESECNIESFNFALLKKFLQANPQTSARISVHHNKRRLGEKFVKQFIAEAVKDFQIPRNHFKIKYAGVDKNLPESYSQVATIKVWLDAKGDAK